MTARLRRLAQKESSSNRVVVDAFGNQRSIAKEDLTDFNREKARISSMLDGTFVPRNADERREMSNAQARAGMGEEEYRSRVRETERDNQGMVFDTASEDGDVKQDQNGDWYVVKKSGNTLLRDYSIDPQENSQGPTFGGNVSQYVADNFSNEVERAGGSTEPSDLPFSELIRNILTGQTTDVPALGFIANQNRYDNNAINAFDAYQQMADTLAAAGLMSLGGKQTPLEPANVGNPPMLRYNPSRDGNPPFYTVLDGLDPDAPISISTNDDGTPYRPYGGGSPFDPNRPNTNNPTGDPNFAPGILPVATEPPPAGPEIRDPDNLLPDDFPRGPSIFPPPDVVPPPFPPGPPPTFDPPPPDPVGPTDPGPGDDFPPPNPTPPPYTGPPDDDDPIGPTGPDGEEVNQDLLDALARRDAALNAQLGNLASAFGFASDDYYNRLAQDYRNSGLSEAFTTAYDDAVRGIYDTYKAAGLLSQSDVDDSLGILAGAEGSEEERIGSIVDQYTAANRNFVDQGKSGIEGDLRGFITDTDDIPTIDAQTSQILGYDVSGRAQPFQTPKEGEVVEFFTDFVKRAYDPSYNVDPTAVASGAPKRASGSVDRLGAGTQPSTIAGILDPVRGGSMRLVN